MLLGDDIVIANDSLAAAYKRNISLLGVGVSEGKTHTSPHTFEFAKRWICLDEEISPFPTSGWWEVRSRYNLLVNVLTTAAQKGWSPLTGVGEAIADFYCEIGRRRKFRRKIFYRSAVCDAITRVIRGVDQAAEALDKLCRLADTPSILHVLEDGGKYIFQSACIEAFTENADPKGSSKHKWNLGSLAERTVCALTDPSFDDDFEVGFNLIQSIPFLGVHGQIEESYLRLKREAFEIDAYRGGD